jgi:uncharacterized membrane protein YdjX (TVP38/TMEM64 family)
MQDRVIEFLVLYEEAAILISICINLVISIFGVIPSFFLTAANIVVFGFWEGMFISFVGEAFGAGFSFWLYRKGLRRITNKTFVKQPKILKLLKVKGKDAFYSIILLRFLPFVPSGLVTFTAAIGEVSGLTFFFASSIGKIPALLIESYSVYHISEWTVEGKIILTIVSCTGLILLFLKRNRNPD